MQMYLMTDGERRVKLCTLQMWNQDSTQQWSEWFHYNGMLCAAQVFYLSFPLFSAVALVSGAECISSAGDLCGSLLLLMYQWKTRAQFWPIPLSLLPWRFLFPVYLLLKCCIHAFAHQPGVSAEISDEDGFLLR